MANEPNETGKERISASFTGFTISKVKKIADEERRSFSLMCELLILEAIEAREQKALPKTQY